ncbi:MAG: FHA domain-containing protein [Polyangiales bacterium]
MTRESGREGDATTPAVTASVRPPSVSAPAKLPALTGVLMTDERGTLVVRRVRVRVTSGPDRGREALLEAGTLLVGTHADNDLVLRDPAVSKYHLELALVAGGVRVRDLGSETGTLVGGARINNTVVPSGTELAIGRTTLQLLGADVSVPSAVSERTAFGPAVGKTQVMRELFGLLERLAPTDSPLLLEGEPGCGRTLLAKAIHISSRFAASPVTVVDFGLSPIERPSLLQIAQRADTFTLLIERIDEAPSGSIPELLALYERREEGVLDARIIATASPGLRAQPTDNKLRKDLLAHACAVRVVVPPLRQRLEDVPLLVRSFIREIAQVDPSFEDGDFAIAMAREYPGNVRELRKLVAKALQAEPVARTMLPSAGIARAKAALLLPLNARPKPPDAGTARQRVLDAFSLDWMQRLIDRTGDVALAAKEAGLAKKDFVAEFDRLKAAIEKKPEPPSSATASTPPPAKSKSKSKELKDEGAKKKSSKTAR